MKTIGTFHQWVGVGGVLVFLGTGQYMDRALDHLRGLDDAPRLLYRSAHIYLLLASLLNLCLGCYYRPRTGPLARWVQRAGSVLILTAPWLILVGFIWEPTLSGLNRPWTRPAVYALLAGSLFHFASGFKASARPSGS